MARPSSATRDFSSLGVGSILNGVAAFGFATTATHAFGSSGASAFVALWTMWLGATAVLTFPIQHWIVLRGIRDHPRRVLAVLALGAGGVVFAACVAFRASLFDSSSFVFPLIAAIIFAAAVPVGVFRGTLIAAGRARRTAVVLAAENVVRLLAGLLVVALGGSVAVFSTAILAGYVVLATYPRAGRHSAAPADDKVALAEVFRSVGLVGASTLIAQLVLAGGPLILAASDAPASVVTATFATLEVCGAAYLIFSATSLRFTAILAERTTPLRNIGWTVTVIGVAIAPVIAAAAFLIGPQVVGLLFGKASELPAGSTALIAAGSVLAVTALMLLLVAVAADRSPQVLLVWLVAAAIGALAFAVLTTEPSMRFAIAFFGVECLAVVGLIAIVARIDAETPVDQ
jgi:hypothetical protein